MNTLINSTSSHSSKCARFWLAAGVSLVTLSAAPRAVAAEPNGFYKVTGGQSLVETDSGTYKVPQKYLRELLLQCDPIKVGGNKLQMKGDIVDCFHRALYLSVTDSSLAHTDTTKVRNSPSITFKDSGGSFLGKANEPIRSIIVRSYEGDVPFFSLRLTTNVSAKVVGDKITVTFRSSGRNENYSYSGKIIIYGNKSRTATSSR